MPPSKKSLRARAQQQVRNQLLVNGDPSEIPSDINRNKTIKKRYKQELEKILATKRQRSRKRVEIFKVNDQIGLGYRAVMNIKAGVKLDEISSCCSKQLNEEQASVSHSAVQYHLPNGNVRYYELSGLLAFVNHACEKHANCITCLAEEEDETGSLDWKFLETNEDIRAGTELTACYSSECTLPCRLCKAT